MSDYVEITGLKETVRNLRTLDADSGAEIKKLNQETAEIVAAEARLRAPIGTEAEGDDHPERMIRSIRVGVTAYSASVRVGGSNMPYVQPIHFGWPRHNIAPNPFLYDALDSRRAEVFEKYDTGIHALCEKASAA